jgi:hypothetical protein
MTRLSAMGVSLCAVAAAALVAALPAAADAPQPANDNRAAAEPIPAFPATLPGTTVGATLERLDPQVSQCGQIDSSVWYQIDPAPDGTIVVGVGASALAPVVRVYRAAASGIKEVDCASAPAGQAAQVSFASVRGAAFLVMVGKRTGTADAAFTLGVKLYLPPPNDARKSAQTIRTLPANISGSTLGATSEAADPESCSIAGGTVWYAVAPGKVGRFVVRLRTAGDLDAAMVVQRKIRSEYSAVACARTDQKGNAVAAVDVVKGAQYFVVIGNREGSAPGEFNLQTLAAQAPERAPGSPLPRVGVRSTVNGLTDVNDMWWTTLQQGTPYRVAFASKGCAVLRVHSLRNPDLSFNTVRCNGYGTFTPGPDGGGRYTFEVVAPTSTATQPYRLQIAPALSDDVGVGIELANLGHVRGSLAPSGVDVVDLYHFDVARTSDVRLALTQPSGRSFGLVLMTDAGQRLSSGSAKIERRLQRGRYVVAVGSQVGTPAGTYGLELVVRGLTSTSITLSSTELPPGAPLTIRAVTTLATGGTTDVQIDRFDPLSGWHFYRLIHLKAPTATLNWTPPALGRWRVRASYVGTLGFSASRSEYVSLLVAKPIA